MCVQIMYNDFQIFDNDLDEDLMEEDTWDLDDDMWGDDDEDSDDEFDDDDDDDMWGDDDDLDIPYSDEE